MLNSVIAKVFGTSNERAVKRIMPTVAQINALEPTILALSDEALRNKTAEFRQRIADAISHIPNTPENADERNAAETLRAPFTGHLCAPSGQDAKYRFAYLKRDPVYVRSKS